jgi:SAM-dependent methyltransferase
MNDGINILDLAAYRLERDPEKAGEVIAMLAKELRRQKLGSEVAEWKSFVGLARAHRLCQLVHLDPLTFRAFSKPRGYQGDAELLDVIYSKSYIPISITPVSPLGKSIFAHTIECQAPGAVRERRGIVATAIDRAAGERSRPHILSVACGHLRELDICESLSRRQLGRFVGLDQDASSVESVRLRFGSEVQTIVGSIKLLLGGSLTRERFDFIYAAGLYDYLGDRVAESLTGKMFQMLKPGGSLLIANYLPDIPDVGYMEVYMGWELIYRTEERLLALAKNISATSIALSFERDLNKNIGYLVAQRT